MPQRNRMITENTQEVKGAGANPFNARVEQPNPRDAEIEVPLPTKTGWRPIRATDLRAIGTEPGTCERCWRRDLRFLHTVAHPDQGQLQVGCECARRLCYGYSPEREEGRLRNLWARRSRWLTRNWGTSWKGNATLRFSHEGEVIRVTVFPDRFGRWSYCITLAGHPHYSPERFSSADAAKLGAFDCLADAGGW